jgi:hypothetical protein
MGKALDLTQTKKPLEKPEVRVWVHNPEGDDFYVPFETVEQARAWIRAKKNPHAEPEPVIAWKGYEWTIEEFERVAKERGGR